MSTLFDHYLIYVTASCAATTAIICLALIFHRSYRNRFMRRLGLSIICLCGFARAITIFDHGGLITPIGQLLWIGLCLFFFSHVCSFIKHLRREKNERSTDHSATQIMMRGDP